MKRTMKEMKKECCILILIKRRTMNIDIYSIKNILGRCNTELDCTPTTESKGLESLINLLYNPDGDYSKDRLDKLLKQLSLLIVIKKSECSYKSKHYTKVRDLLTFIFEKKGMPNFETFIGATSEDFGMTIEEARDSVISCVENKKNLKWEVMRKCGLFTFYGIGSSTILNISYFLIKGFIPDVEKLGKPPEEKVDYNQLINSLTDSISKLTTENRKYEAKQIQHEVCSICFEKENLVANEKCGHKFHTECLVKWLEHKSSCPVCRIKLID